MTTARKALISLQDTPYYHLVARCVRRAWLWGVDDYAGRDYSHRKTWVLERIQQLSGIFAIDVCAYAVMSNHYHLVVHVASARASAWSDQAIIKRWTRLFRAPSIIERFQQGLCGPAESAVAKQLIERWRQRLTDVSWYMRCLNEHLARRANQEDGCTGRFWEGRFKSQALLDEAGLLTAMVYVDLNPIRAGIAQTPEESEFTSIYQRIQAIRHSVHLDGSGSPRSELPQIALLRFQDEPLVTNSSNGAIPFVLRDYLALVDWSGRARAPNKRGSIDEQLPSIVKRLNIDPDAWLGAMCNMLRKDIELIEMAK